MSGTTGSGSGSGIIPGRKKITLSSWIRNRHSSSKKRSGNRHHRCRHNHEPEVHDNNNSNDDDDDNSNGDDYPCQDLLQPLQTQPLAPSHSSTVVGVVAPVKKRMDDATNQPCTEQHQQEQRQHHYDDDDKLQQQQDLDVPQQAPQEQGRQGHYELFGTNVPDGNTSTNTTTLDHDDDALQLQTLKQEHSRLLSELQRNKVQSQQQQLQIHQLQVALQKSQAREEKFRIQYVSLHQKFLKWFYEAFTAWAQKFAAHAATSPTTSPNTTTIEPPPWMMIDDNINNNNNSTTTSPSPASSSLEQAHSMDTTNHHHHNTMPVKDSIQSKPLLVCTTVPQLNGNTVVTKRRRHRKEWSVSQHHNNNNVPPTPANSSSSPPRSMDRNDHDDDDVQDQEMQLDTIPSIKDRRFTGTYSGATMHPHGNNNTSSSSSTSLHNHVSPNEPPLPIPNDCNRIHVNQGKEEENAFELPLQSASSKDDNNDDENDSSETQLDYEPPPPQQLAAAAAAAAIHTDEPQKATDHPSSALLSSFSAVVHPTGRPCHKSSACHPCHKSAACDTLLKDLTNSATTTTTTKIHPKAAAAASSLAWQSSRRRGWICNTASRLFLQDTSTTARTTTSSSLAVNKKNQQHVQKPNSVVSSHATSSTTTKALYRRTNRMRNPASKTKATVTLNSPQKVMKRSYSDFRNEQVKMTRSPSEEDDDDDEIEPNYPYQEVVRNRRKRNELPAHVCPECELFAIKSGLDPKEFLSCSRHRAAHNPNDNATPPGYWDISFQDSIDARRITETNNDDHESRDKDNDESEK